MTTRPRTLIAALLVAAVVPLTSCTSTQMDGESVSYLIIDQLRASSGAEPDKLENVLNSDVMTGGGVVEDGGAVTFRLALKDPGTISNPGTPSPSNFITVTRYRVEYVRSDGRNTPGVDVPFPFDGAFTATVTASPTTATFTLVSVQAKLESPLRALAFPNGAGAIVISTLADVTFYGHDQAGREVMVKGRIGVDFADWADPE
jgi:hypothetical protein